MEAVPAKHSASKSLLLNPLTGKHLSASGSRLVRCHMAIANQCYQLVSSASYGGRSVLAEAVVSILEDFTYL